MKFELTGLRGVFQPSASGEAGFTLLETLVGLTIFAVALTALFGAYSSSTRAALASERYARAQILAQSLLARATATRDPRAARAKGSTLGFRWRVTARTTADQQLPEAARARAWQLYRIKVSVGWDRNRTFELATLRLMRAAPCPPLLPNTTLVPAVASTVSRSLN